jgi:hypothetical protein
VSPHPWRSDMVRVLGLVGLLLLASHGLPRVVNARQATPASLPARCNVAPRSAEEVLELAEPTPGEGSRILPLPSGKPSDPATTSAITAVLAEMGACLTAGDMLRFYALHSDDWLRQFAAEIEGVLTITTSTPPLADGHRAVYLGPWHVEVLSDGRVLAAVLLRVGDEHRPDPKRTRVLLFVHQDGRWLVDETIEMVRLPDCEGPVDVVAVVGPPPGTGLLDSWSEPCA